jgi:hypothetical protein
MTILALSLLIVSWVVGIYYYGRALKHLAPGIDPVGTLFLGSLASDERFTPIGRRYRMIALGWSLGGTLVAVLVFLAAGS